MLARSTFSRGAPQWLAPAVQRRTMAAVAAQNPFHYTVGEAAGIKVASRDDGGPTTNLAVVVRGGSRYETLPGVAHALEKFAFKNTTNRSSLRLQRESELLGGVLSSSLSRENIILRAKFLRDDLPYFVEVLGEVLAKTKFDPYEFDEQIAHTLHYELLAEQQSAPALALSAAHATAFHKGLGSPVLAITHAHLNNKTVPSYASTVYTRSNLAVVASGAPHAALEKWTSEFFSSVPTGTGPTTIPATYHGGENRIYSTHGNALTIAFPGSPAAPNFKPEFTVLAYILGGETSIKWATGSSVLAQATSTLPGVNAVAKHAAYTDAGLLYITVSGPAGALTEAGKKVVDAVKGLSGVKAEDVKKAIAQAKFDVLAAAEDRFVGLGDVGQSVIASGKAVQVEGTVKGLEGVTLEGVKNAVKTILGGKATFAAVGDLHVLPYAEEIGLTV